MFLNTNLFEIIQNLSDIAKVVWESVVCVRVCIEECESDSQWNSKVRKDSKNISQVNYSILIVRTQEGISQSVPDIRI